MLDHRMAFVPLALAAFVVALAVDRADALTFADTADLYVLDHASGSVIKVTPTGGVSVAVTAQQIKALTGKSSVDFENRGLAFDSAGNMYFSESASKSVIKRSVDGVLSTLSTSAAFTAATGEASANPRGLDVGYDNFLYVNDSVSDALLKVDLTSGGASVLASKADMLAAGPTSTDLICAIVAHPNGNIYLATDQAPDTVFGIQPDGSVFVLSSDPAFFDLDVFMTLDPVTGDLIIANDGSGGGNDAGDHTVKQPDEIFRLKLDGSLSSYLTESTLDALVAGLADLEGGLAFDDLGRFYLAETTSASIYRFNNDGTGGALFVSADDIQNLTGVRPIFEGGIAFAPVLRDPSSTVVPEPLTLGSALLSLSSLTLLCTRRRAR